MLETFALTGSSPLILTIHTSLFDWYGSWGPAGVFGMVSRIYLIVKSLSSIKLGPILFPSCGYSMSYLTSVASKNGLSDISS